MKYSYFLLIPVMCALVFSSCEKVIGEGPLVTQTRDVTNFKNVSVSIGGNIIYKIEPVYKVEVRAQQNILNVLQTTKVGDDLVIKYKDGVRVKDHEEVTVTISAPAAESVQLSGSGEFIMINQLSSANLNLRISGSGNITIPDLVLTDKLSAEISGSGNITVSNGAIKNESLKISGSGAILLPTLTAETTTADISGSGDMRVSVSQSLNAKISGSGSVFYHGHPLVTTNISGSGKVIPF